MGLMSAARARLGLSLASEKNICNLISQFTRRSSTCASTILESSEEKKNTLYLCFARNTVVGKDKLKGWSNIVRPVKLDSYNDEEVAECKDAIHSPIRECSTEEKDYEKGEKHKSCTTICTRYGSRILFQSRDDGGRISWVDPTTHPPEFQVSSPNPKKNQIPSLSDSTHGVMGWGEIDHKLYCIHDFSKRKFEVLESDSRNDVVNWCPLDPAPEGNYYTFFDHEEYLFLNRSKKILYWRCGKWGVHVYDITAPEKGWLDSNQPTLRDAVPFLLRGHPVFVIDDLHHSSLGNFNLVFNLVVPDDIECKRAVVFPFLLSENCDTFQSINNPIHLPPEIDIRWTQFVNLGDQKFCLVVHKPCDDTSLVLTYEYDVMVNGNNALEIQSRLLGKRRFRYPSSNDDGCWYLDHLGGAYML